MILPETTFRKGSQCLASPSTGAPSRTTSSMIPWQSGERPQKRSSAPLTTVGPVRDRPTAVEDMDMTPARMHICTHCCLVAQSCPTVYDSTGCSTPGFPVLAAQAHSCTHPCQRTPYCGFYSEVQALGQALWCLIHSYKAHTPSLCPTTREDGHSKTQHSQKGMNE